MKNKLALLMAATFIAGPLTADSGRSHMRLESPFQSCSPEFLALTASEAAKQQKENDRNGSVKFTIFGGRNAKRAEAASYYMPGDNTLLTVSGKVSDSLQTLFYTGPDARIGEGAGTRDLGYTDGNLTQGSPDMTAFTIGGAEGLAYNVGTGTAIVANDANADNVQAPQNVANSLAIEGGGQILNDDGSAVDNLAINTDSVRSIGLATHPYQMDTNKDDSILRPWNFGVTFATRVQPGLPVVEPDFESTIAPELHRTHFGVGAAWRQHLSEDAAGFWFEASTAIQRVKSEMKLNEEIKTEKTFAADAVSYDSASIHVAGIGAGGQGSLVNASSWADQGFPVGDSAPKNLTEAFAQDAWLYGKIDGATTKTRLADVEVKLGYNFVAEDNYSSAGYLGFVLPTGNKADGVYVAQAIVGNGKHFGFMLGSDSEMLLSSDADFKWSMRSNADARYLFRNTQTRSFDVGTNGAWSRYMMVWKDFASANTAMLSDGTDNLIRSFTPGINEFTQDVYVTPRAQARLNQALILESGSFRGELGWNFSIRQSEKVELVEAWDKKVVFADASKVSSSYWNPNRTIYNDSYETTVTRIMQANGMVDFYGTEAQDELAYNNNAVKADDLNMNSAASPMSVTNTPYLTMGYAWENGNISLGASYEFSKDNSYETSWMLWGKLGFSF